MFSDIEDDEDEHVDAMINLDIVHICECSAPSHKHWMAMQDRMLRTLEWLNSELLEQLQLDVKPSMQTLKEEAAEADSTYATKIVRKIPTRLSNTQRNGKRMKKSSSSKRGPRNVLRHANVPLDSNSNNSQAEEPPYHTSGVIITQPDSPSSSNTRDTRGRANHSSHSNNPSGPSNLVYNNNRGRRGRGGRSNRGGRGRSRRPRGGYFGRGSSRNVPEPPSSDSSCGTVRCTHRQMLDFFLMGLDGLRGMDFDD